MKQGSNVQYDSVKGNTNGSDVYMVYQNVKTYPGLLVKYKTQWRKENEEVIFI